MPELIPTTTEAEWLAARRNGVTASEIAVLMGLSPYDSPYALFHRKLGILPQQDDNLMMERGRVLEPYVAEKFARAHPELAVLGDGRQLYAHPGRHWQMATPDRLVNMSRYGDTLIGCTPAVLETKADGGSDEWGEPGTDDIPLHYRCQALWQMDVMGVDRAYVACLRVRDWRVLEYVIGHDSAGHMPDYTGEAPMGDCRACVDLDLMRIAARDFLDRIDLREPPDVDWRPQTAAALKAMHPDVEDREVVIGRQLELSYRAAVRRAREAEQRKDEMTARVLLAMGSARKAVGRDGPVATRSVSHPKRVSTDMLRERHPAIAAECTPEPKPVIKLTPAKTRRTP